METIAVDGCILSAMPGTDSTAWIVLRWTSVKPRWAWHFGQAGRVCLSVVCCISRCPTGFGCGNYTFPK